MSELERIDDAEVVGEDIELLDDLARRIRAEHCRAKDAMGDAVEASLVIGRCLMEARAALISDQAYGAWLRAQEFPFSQQWAHTLRAAAENEIAFQAAVTTQVVTGGSPNIKQAVKQATAGSGRKRGKEPVVGSDVLARLQKKADEEKPEGKNSPSASRRREQQLRELAETGHSTRQIAKILDVNPKSVFNIAKRIGVSIAADEMVGNTLRIDPNRVISEAVIGIEGYCIGIGLIDSFDAVDSGRREQWVASLTSSIRTLTQLNTTLKGASR